MPDVMESAAPSVAEEIAIPQSGTPEYAEWRVRGTIPAKPKPAESAPADKPKEATSEIVPAAEPGKKQEKRKPDAEARIAQLTARQRQLEKDLEEARKPKTAQAEPPPARQPESTRPKPKVDDKTEDGNPKYASYEDFVEELSDWKAEQRLATQERERKAAENLARVKSEVEEASKRYPDFWDKASIILEDLKHPSIRPEVLAIINDSPVLADLLYVIAGNEATRADFLAACRENPSKAIRVAMLAEQEIQKEVGKGSESTQRNDRGQFIAPKAQEVKPPAKRGPESAPEPPIEIGSRGSTVKDEAQRAFEDIERGDPNAFKRYRDAQNAKELRRLRGA